MCEISDLEEENEKLEEELSIIQEEMDEVELKIKKLKTNTFRMSGSGEPWTSVGGYVSAPSYNGANNINTNENTVLGYPKTCFRI